MGRLVPDPFDWAFTRAQVSVRRGVLFSVERKNDDTPSLAVLENVRCLECGAVYAKPARGGTAKANPGCPECGYVGWLSVSVSAGAEIARLRSAADRHLPRSAQSH